ncbi:MAG: electron transfer flavoprotein subunit beta/FixA family protein [Peptococcaceae bacterium]|jgi:electron transfer flavoprotein beta subunit|nr:electron transfer flavoprotein subunit beta/FixA family protein [Peptococcaceae bacterium]
MNIVACIKQVPDTSEVKIDRETNTLIREGVPSIINPFDLNAIEEGLLLKERFGGSVTVISMGPPQVESALREALSLGVDRVVLLCDRAFAGSDTLATSCTLAAAIREIGFDLILCGKQAIDGDTAQVGPEIAEWLDVPHLTYISAVEEVSDRSITVSRLLEGGYERVRASLPALLTVVKELNEPRLPGYRASLRAKTEPVTTWGAAGLNLDPANIGMKGSPTKVTRSFVPELGRQGQFLAGSPEEQAAALIAALRSARIVHGSAKES